MIMNFLRRTLLSYFLMVSTIVHGRQIPDEYCTDLKPFCTASPVCQEIDVGTKVYREWTCSVGGNRTHLEYTPFVNQNDDLQSKPGKFEIDVRIDLAGRNPPVLLIMDERGEWKMAEPTRRTRYKVYMNLEGKRILLACPGKGNSLRTPGVPQKQTVEAYSDYTNGKTYFIIANEQHETDSIKCLRRVSPYEYMSGAACNGDGVLLSLGYFINNKMMELIRSCHRLVDGLTYYSRHILDGSHFPIRGYGGKRKDEARRPQFSYHNRALFRNFPPQNYYNQKAQNQIISGVLGDGVIFGKGEQFFSRGHLTPNSDFIISTWRDVTFSYVNAQPQWQQINAGNWNKIETKIRYNAAETAKKYEVITGVAGNLILNEQKVHLDKDHQRLPVPNRYTKLVREIETNKCITFIVNNFPLESNPEQECRDVCTSYNWLQDVHKPQEAGYVYCCTYNDFRQAFPKAAPEVDCGGGVLVNRNSQRSDIKFLSMT